MRSFVGLHPCSRSRSVPYPNNVHVSVPAPDSVPNCVPAPDSVPVSVSVPTLIPPMTPFASSSPSHPIFPPWFDVRVQTPGHAIGAVGCTQTPPLICRDDDACGMEWADRVYKPCAVSCAHSSLLRPFWSCPRFRSCFHSCPSSNLRYCSRFHPCSRSHFHPVFFDGSTRLSPFPFPPRPRSRSRPIPTPAPVPIWRSFVRLHLSSRSRSGYAPFIVHVPVAVFDPAPVSDPAPDPVCSFPFLGPGYPLGTMRVYRPRFLCMRVCACVYLVSHNHS